MGFESLDSGLPSTEGCHSQDEGFLTLPAHDTMENREMHLKEFKTNINVARNIKMTDIKGSRTMINIQIPHIVSAW